MFARLVSAIAATVKYRCSLSASYCGHGILKQWLAFQCGMCKALMQSFNSHFAACRIRKTTSVCIGPSCQVKNVLADVLPKTVLINTLLPDRKVEHTNMFGKGFDYSRIVEWIAEHP